MKFNADNYIEELNISKARRMAVVAIVAVLSLSFASGAVLAGEHEGRHGGDYRTGGDYESKIYGIVEKLPQDLVGAWVVNNREIMVTKDTRIKEKHGKVEAGAYVEVEGNVAGKTFTAYKVEVKRSKQSGR
jgi:hypothetical protein